MYLPIVLYESVIHSTVVVINDYTNENVMINLAHGVKLKMKKTTAVNGESTKTKDFKLYVQAVTQVYNPVVCDKIKVCKKYNAEMALTHVPVQC